MRRDERLRPARGSDGGGKAQGFARSLGTAVGFVHRLVVGGDEDEGAGSPKRPGDRTVESRPASVVKSRRRSEAKTVTARHRALKGEVDRLERDLDRVHARITSGALSDVRGGAGYASDLEALIAQSRRLREQLAQRREDLARVERYLARDRRLEEVPESVDAEAVQAEARHEDRGRRQTSRRRRTASGAGKGRERVLQAVRKASMHNRSERLAYEKTAEELLASDPNARRGAVRSLARDRAPLASELLRIATEDSDDSVARAALNALVGREELANVRSFRRFLNHEDPLFRLAALRGLDGFDEELRANDLVDALDDPEPAVRKTAASMLGWHPATDSLPPLRLALHDESEAVRGAACEALGMLGDERAVRALICRLGDDDASVRALADDALRRIVGSDFDAAIGPISEPGERVIALEAWWRFARVANAVRRLGGALEDIDREVSESPVEDLITEVVGAPSDVAAELEEFESVIVEEPPSESPAQPAEDATEESASPVKSDDEEAEYEDIF